jgi:hypothetical protein
VVALQGPGTVAPTRRPGDELPQARSLNGHRRSGAHTQSGALDALRAHVALPQSQRQVLRRLRAKSI